MSLLNDDLQSILTEGKIQAGILSQQTKTNMSQEDIQKLLVEGKIQAAMLQEDNKEMTQEDIQEMLSEGKIAAAILNQQEQKKLSNNLNQEDIMNMLQEGKVQAAVVNQQERAKYGIGGILMGAAALSGYAGGKLYQRNQRELKQINDYVKENKLDTEKFLETYNNEGSEFNKYLENTENANPKVAKKLMEHNLKLLNELREEEILEQDKERYKQEQIENLRATANKGGSMDNQMMMIMSAKPMESDIDMEDNYTKFIMEEALTEDEEDMLVSKLEQDNELQMLFDKVIDVAQEFAGSGPVEGPGSGVSDSIPARLSDGEFVFTAKATEEIGEDKLMSMMKEAEANADERQEMMHGGIPHMDKGEEQILSNVNRKQVVNTGTNVLEEDETSKNIKGNMYNPNIQDKYVRS